MSASTRPHDPVAVCVAPNGARKTAADHPALPTTLLQVARVARECAEQGATLLHLHVRDAQDRHTLDPHHYRAAMAAVEHEAGPDLLLQVTTESVGLYTPAEQFAVVRELVPAAASVALREVLPDMACLPALADFLAWARREQVALQWIVYTPQETAQLVALTRQGDLLTDRPHALFVIGRHGTAPTMGPHHLTGFLNHWPEDWPWSVCAFGAHEAPAMAAAIGLGGHTRVGFENNHLRVTGEPVDSNAELVRGVGALAALAGRPVATVAQARVVYGITRDRRSGH